MQREDRNLIVMFRAFYQLNIASDLSSSCLAIFMGILYRANELGFPDDLRITNSELCAHASLQHSAFNKCRKTLTDYRCNNQWLIKYSQGTTHRCGTYKINYELLQIIPFNGTKGNKRVTKPDIKGNKRVTKPSTIPIQYNTIQDNISLSAHKVNLVTKSDDLEISNAEQSEQEYLKELEEEKKQWFTTGKKLIEGIYPNYFINSLGGPLNTQKNEFISSIGMWSIGYPDMVRDVLNNVAGRLKKPENLLQFAYEDIQKKRGITNGTK